MSEPLTKIEQLDKLKYELEGVKKHQVLIGKIVSGYKGNAQTLPPVCCRTNPQYSNYMALDTKYLPMSEDQFWDGYQENMKMKIESIQADIDDLLN